MSHNGRIAAAVENCGTEPQPTMLVSSRSIIMHKVELESHSMDRWTDCRATPYVAVLTADETLTLKFAIEEPTWLCMDMFFKNVDDNRPTIMRIPH